MTIRVYGKRALSTPSGRETRPSSWRIRQALFDWPAPTTGARWLDLCCGAGTIGAEALSRGASFVVGIDKSRAACSMTRRNWIRIASEAQTVRVITAPAEVGLRRLRGKEFDVVYLDPPYESDVYERVMLLVGPVLAADGVFFAEHGRRRVLPESVGELRQLTSRTYGEGALTAYKVER